MTRAASVGILRQRLFGITILVLGGLLTHGTYAGTGDEPHYLAIAHSLAFDFDLDVANNYGRREPLIADGGMQPDDHVRPGRGGVVRPVHDIGMPLLFAPYIRVVVPAVSWMAPRIPPRVMHRLQVTPTVLYRHLISAAMIVLAGFLATLMFDAFITIGLTAQAAFWTALLVALSPPLLIHAILFFTELLSALFCFIVFRRIALDEQMASPWSWALAGGVAGMLLLVHVRNAGLVAGLVLIALQRLARRSAARELMAFLASLCGLLLVRTAINYHMWGTWRVERAGRRRDGRPPARWHVAGPGVRPAAVCAGVRARRRRPGGPGTDSPRARVAGMCGRRLLRADGYSAGHECVRFYRRLVTHRAVPRAYRAAAGHRCGRGDPDNAADAHSSTHHPADRDRRLRVAASEESVERWGRRGSHLFPRRRPRLCVPAVLCRAEIARASPGFIATPGQTSSSRRPT